ncbi:MAG TPA: UDP-2,4-diacetamido-2,4,6-trideoxy-beta-L-altropyranose hydrolase [Aurantimonas coralicida]|uniref:UDP-2,4-diacetamido-2,4, 6-trideoxy-beta-L-altropyranose hydrolase n=2 Tax=root TaxID=1 RepID=A0A9C9NK00_9HYPH|nr:UDP-2,4-diacetamido-2,4,6-trideoxy-beta-L-altropyranose hydrolase [Aurantimonas coralicida]HEU02740.1 UDP-2,4-diacetamido-2,4,6-trideoxy-beta-L-altropyranose hydrolase [Aurantimonas coralicida]
MTGTAVFRCDASQTIGGGHVVRCMALAAALREAGWAVRFAVSDATPRTVRELGDAFPASLTGLRCDSSDSARLRAEWPEGIDLLVVDHYGLGEAFEQAAGGWARRILVIDDFPNRRHHCTHLVDTTHGRRAEDYAGLVPSGAKLMCGSSYAMLRGPFRRRRASGPLKAGGDRLAALVTFGMTDAPNATGITLAGLLPLAGMIDVVVVLGASAPHAATVADLLRGGAPFWRLVTDADAATMAALTAEADLVIGAPGSASYERCCLGKPALLLQLADNQAGNAASLVAAGAAELLGGIPGVTAADVEKAVRRLEGDRDRLTAMGSAAAKITDGRGVERIVAALEAE